ncbi:MAG: lactoylglutathione lyase [Frankiales bacterium]|jgi:catechol 2,3-dioxygenase-like lactoylglutathione lyase family enzyme|nr:lactoylglutathione lyase [Frankiales bacterium]
MNPVVNHVGHCVADIERARRFYVEALGFEPWFELQPPDDPSSRLLGLSPPLGMNCVYLRMGEFVLELLQFADAGTVDAPQRVVNQLGLTHLSFAVDDVAATCNRVAELGGTVLTETDIGAAIFVRDPDGQLIELLPMGYRTSLPPIPR